MSLLTLEDVRKLKPLHHSSILLNQRGRVWRKSGLAVLLPELRAHYGHDIPMPSLAVEADDKTLVMWWECGGKPAVIRLDELSWDWT